MTVGAELPVGWEAIAPAASDKLPKTSGEEDDCRHVLVRVPSSLRGDFERSLQGFQVIHSPEDDKNVIRPHLQPVFDEASTLSSSMSASSSSLHVIQSSDGVQALRVGPKVDGILSVYSSTKDASFRASAVDAEIMHSVDCSIAQDGLQRTIPQPACIQRLLDACLPKRAALSSPPTTPPGERSQGESKGEEEAEEPMKKPRHASTSPSKHGKKRSKPK
jgi:hypothetical protein